MRRLVASAVGVEGMLGGGCGLGQLHQAMLMHSLLAAMQHSNGSLASSYSSSTSSTSSTSSASSTRKGSLSSCSEPSQLLLSGLGAISTPFGVHTAPTAPDTPTSASHQDHDEQHLLSTPSSAISTSPTTPTSASHSIPIAALPALPAPLDSPHYLSLLYFYEPPAYPLPSPLRILSASSSPAAHFPFPHAYFALWLRSRWDDGRWMNEWVAARRREEDSERLRRQRRREMEKQYSSDTSGESTQTVKATIEVKKPTVNAECQQRREHEKAEAEWTLERHERVAAATLSDLNQCVRWLGEFASPTHPHGEVFGYLVTPLTKRQGRARHAGRDYEYAFTDGSQPPNVNDSYQPPGPGGWDRIPVVSWRVVCAPSRMRFALTVWPCLYVYMRSLCAPGLIDGWARRMGLEKPTLSECSIRARMFLHMAAMDRWEAMQ